jgi:MFS family permease
MKQKSFVVWMCLGQIGNLLPHVVVPAVMTAHLIPQWGLSNTEAGLLAAAYAAGYMVAVPVLSALTDRFDARQILFWGSLASASATVSFGLFANGYWAGLVFWCLAGMGFAGAYMPGLRALTDRLNPGDASRSVTYYTSSFSLGVGLSFLASQYLADALGWRWAFLLTGLGPLLMLVFAWRMQAKPPPPPSGALLDFRPVIRNRSAMGFIVAYGIHCFELYGIRTWIVAFWTFVIEQHAHSEGTEALIASWATPVMVSVVFTVLAMPASIAGNELSLRYGRHRAISGIQFASASIALLIGLNTNASIIVLLPMILLYAITVPADSGSLTSGMSENADTRFRGATLAMHSTLGFGLSALAGWALGYCLDQFGGTSRGDAWQAAFLLLATSILFGPLALKLSKTPVLKRDY